MTKAWLTCVLLCGVCLQVNATENNNHAEIKELLKPAPLNTLAAPHSAKNSGAAFTASKVVNSQDNTSQASGQVSGQGAGSNAYNAQAQVTDSTIGNDQSQGLSAQSAHGANGYQNLTSGAANASANANSNANANANPDATDASLLADDLPVFQELTAEQQTKLENTLREIFKTLDETQMNSLRQQFNLSLAADQPLDQSLLVPLLQAVAALPNAYALNQLGDMYKLGHGVIQDRKQAFACYKQAAALGNTVSMNNIGECYSYGIGCVKNLETAAQWYKKAARLGNVEAQFNLGYVYEYGEGVPLDVNKARYWYEKAASQQHADSMLFLGQMYLDGDGVPLNESLAKDYFGRACDLGSTDGCDLYQVMLSDNN